MATIKKGSYRWNDIVSIYPNFDNLTILDGSPVLPINFTVVGSFAIDLENMCFIEGETVCNYDYIVFDRENSSLNFYSSFENILNGWVYSPEYGWNFAAQIMGDMLPNSELLNGFGQIININEDINVDDTSATWFEANTEPVGAEATVSYNGEAIATITSGQTATIKCKGKVMKDDIVITL